MTPPASRATNSGHSLRVSGTDSAAADSRTLGLCTFGEQAGAGAITHPGLQPLTAGPTCEIWRGVDTITSGTDNSVDWRTDGALLFGHITTALAGDDVAAATEALYRGIFQCLETQQFRHLLRVWNFLPGINEGAGDTERYKAFCAGRARVFDDCPLAQDQYPAATAIGTRTGNLLNIYFLAACTPGRRVENPRQTSAPDYPRQYGPRSPRFARATAWPQEQPRVLLASGTASIVGHETRHLGDSKGQLEEIWRNLEALRQRTGATQPTAMRVYLRHASDLAIARDYLTERLPTTASAVYLQADICRPELLLEIEATYRF